MPEHVSAEYSLFEEKISKLFDEAGDEYVLSWKLLQQQVAQAFESFISPNWLDTVVYFVSPAGLVLRLVDFINRFGNAVVDFSIRIGQIPIRLLSRELISDYFPVPAHLSQRVFTAAEAYKLMANQIVELALDIVVNNNYPGFVTHTQRRVDLAVAQFTFVKAVALGREFEEEGWNALKKTVKARVKVVLIAAIALIGAVVVVAMLYLLATKLNNPARLKELEARCLPQRRAFHFIKGRRRVRIQKPEIARVR